MYARVLQCVCSAQSEHFALRLQPCFPPSVLPAAFASTKALLSTCYVPQARMRRPLVPQCAWTARSEHSATLAARFSLSSALAAFSALKRRLLHPRRAPSATTALPTACSTSCCVQRAITAQAPALLPLCPVPQVITRRKQADHRRIPALSAHLVTNIFFIICDMCVCYIAHIWCIVPSNSPRLFLRAEDGFCYTATGVPRWNVLRQHSCHQCPKLQPLPQPRRLQRCGQDRTRL